MFRLSRHEPDHGELPASKLYDQDSLYTKLIADLRNAKREVIIESPFITTARISQLMLVLLTLRKRNVRIIINTKDPEEHSDGYYRNQAEQAIFTLQEAGVIVLYTSGHHRKLAIIDQVILWEGSLNILSYHDSCEVMRRMYSEQAALEMRNFIRIAQYLA